VTDESVFASFDRAPTAAELVALLADAIAGRPEVATYGVVVEIDRVIAELRGFRLAVTYPDPRTEDPHRFLVLAGVEVDDGRRIIREVAENRAWYEDGYGRAMCFYCSGSGLEPHDADCIYVLARKLVNLAEPATVEGSNG
jgi:hypothetical protein